MFVFGIHLIYSLTDSEMHLDNSTWIGHCSMVCLISNAFEASGASRDFFRNDTVVSSFDWDKEGEEHVYCSCFIW